MVCLKTLEAMERYYEEHLKEFVRDHAGEYVFIGRDAMTHTIYPDEDVVKTEHPELYGCMTFGTNPLVRKIPKRYVTPWSQMDAEEKSRKVHKDTMKLLKKMDEFEKKSRKVNLSNIVYG